LTGFQFSFYSTSSGCLGQQT